MGPNFSTIVEEDSNGRMNGHSAEEDGFERSDVGKGMGDEPDDFGRIYSNGQASSSNGNLVRQGDLDDLFLRELRACEELEDIVEMALEESENMDGAWISACLLRYIIVSYTIDSRRIPHCTLLRCSTLGFLNTTFTFHFPMQPHERY